MFPVDEGAAFYKFEARLDGRTIIAHCMEKKKVPVLYCNMYLSVCFTIICGSADRLNIVINISLMALWAVSGLTPVRLQDYWVKFLGVG